MKIVYPIKEKKANKPTANWYASVIPIDDLKVEIINPKPSPIPAISKIKKGNKSTIEFVNLSNFFN